MKCTESHVNSNDIEEGQSLQRNTPDNEYIFVRNVKMLHNIEIWLIIKIVGITVHLVILLLFTLHVNNILILPVPHLLFFQLLLSHLPVVVVIISFLLFFFSLVILDLIPVLPISLYAHLTFAPFLLIPTLLPYLWSYSLSSSGSCLSHRNMDQTHHHHHRTCQ